MTRSKRTKFYLLPTGAVFRYYPDMCKDRRRVKTCAEHASTLNAFEKVRSWCLNEHPYENAPIEGGPNPEAFLVEDITRVWWFLEEHQYDSQGERMEDKEVPNPRREGWFARDALRRSTEVGGIPSLPAPKYPAGTPEREEWEAGWNDLEESLGFRKTHPDTLLGYCFPPRRRYRCSICGTLYETMFHCQSLSRVKE